MGIMEVFKKKQVKGFFAPMSGKIMPLSEVPDPVFSQKMMGDGFAILPSEGKVYSPVAGKVVSIFPTKHAIGLVSDEGHEILIHFGIDTVQLQGEGFRVHVKEGAKVKVGDLLLRVDLEQVEQKAPSLITPVVFTNLETKEIRLLKTGNVLHGEENILEIV